jgi:hypothetical protein
MVMKRDSNASLGFGELAGRAGKKASVPIGSEAWQR